MLKKNQPFLSSFCLCHLPDGPASLLLPPGYEKAVQTQPVSPGLPWERYPTFTPLFFFPSSRRYDSSLFIYSWMPVLLLIILQRIWVGFVWAVLGFIYRDVLTHPHPVSQLVVCRCKRWRICDGKAEIVILNLPSRFDKLCVSFGYDWWTFWEVGAAFEDSGGGFLHALPVTPH